MMVRVIPIVANSPTQNLAMRNLGRRSSAMKSLEVSYALGIVCRLSRRCRELDTMFCSITSLSRVSFLFMSDDICHHVRKFKDNI